MNVKDVVLGVLATVVVIWFLVTCVYMYILVKSRKEE